MDNLYEKLHKLYPVQKTIRFELKPIGKTKENIEIDGILEEDEHRAQTYKKVKKYCDEYHKKFIEEALQNVELKNLKQYYELYKIENKDSKQKEEFEKIKQLLRKEISDSFKKNKKEYDGLFSKEMIKTYLKTIYKEQEEPMKEIQEFDKFTTYFTGYNQNRENIYTDEEKATAISYRLINENLPTFLYNAKIYQNIIKKIPQIITKTYSELEEYIQTTTLDEMFVLDYYNDVLTQKGIEIYNLVIAGRSEKEGSKIKGLNEYINEYNQTHKDRIPKLKELYKQILSDKIGTSFVIDKIHDDNELTELMLEYYLKLKEIMDNSEQTIEQIFENINNYDIQKIYLKNDLSISNISQYIFKEWNYIENCINQEYDRKYTGKVKQNTDKYYEKRKEELNKIKFFSIGYLEECITNANTENRGKIIEYFSKYLKNENIINEIKKQYEKCEEILNKNYQEGSMNLIKDSEAIKEIKTLLDLIKRLQEYVKTIIPTDKSIELDAQFYSDIESKYEILSEIIPLYNKVRNYLTQKPYSTEKIKLNFQSPTFLGGWDISKEKENLGTILLKDNNYYLAILNKKNKKLFDEVNQTEDNENVYKKMEYKLLPSPNKMLPKVFFSKSRIDEFEPSNELLEKYEKGLHKKGNNDFNINFCHELIDFYKESIDKNSDWKSLDFSFYPTEKYEDISQFYKQVEQQGYSIKFVNFSEEYINEKVNSGELYLFQIYNKDFSNCSKGTPNLHTLYWRMLFNTDNLNDVVYKINGEAEVFYRKASLKLEDTAIHKAHQPINNKNIDTIKRNPTSTFEYDIIKNKRYTVDKFQFHVPITMNFKNEGVNNINEIVNKNLKYNENIHVIGIDRGERNLIYVTVIDHNENIVYQKSLNEIVNVYKGIEYKTDYHNLLDIREKKIETSKKSWETIDNIKELKEGYMSQVIHEITKLIQQYNAIIVIEDLNKGFKNSRIKVEKQVYQKFEQMLINKLNYLVIKNKNIKEEGGLLNAYQLTNKFESFKKMGKQSGILFYIPAWCTSKIDPLTGFINLFYIKSEGLEKSKEFVNKFEDIRFNEKENYFEFNIDYSKFTDRLYDSKTKWTICTNSTRIRTFRNPKSNNEWSNKEINLTDEFKKLFTKKEYDIDVNNIKESILEKADSAFFNATEEKDGFYGFTTLFKLTVQMRNSRTGEMEDYLISPVRSESGEFFDTRKSKEDLPKDADANGAYNIARKGLMLINQIKETEDNQLNHIKYDISNKEWINFAQNKGKI